MTRTKPRAKPVDDVERLRQVRREIESEHPTLDALYDWLEELDGERLVNARPARKPKPATRRRPPQPRKSARPRS